MWWWYSVTMTSWTIRITGSWSSWEFIVKSSKKYFIWTAEWCTKIISAYRLSFLFLKEEIPSSFELSSNTVGFGSFQEKPKDCWGNCTTNPKKINVLKIIKNCSEFLCNSNNSLLSQYTIANRLSLSWQGYNVNQA